MQLADDSSVSVVLTAFSIFTNALTTVLCEMTHIGSTGVVCGSFAVCVLLSCFVVLNARRASK